VFSVTGEYVAKLQGQLARAVLADGRTWIYDAQKDPDGIAADSGVIDVLDLGNVTGHAERVLVSWGQYQPARDRNSTRQADRAWHVERACRG
jgi:hypothetical protein